MLVFGCTRAHAGPATTPPSAASSQSTESLRGLENAFERAASQIGPSVVSIASVKNVSRQQVPPFMRPFIPDEDLRQEGLGTGVIVDARGYILTNNHVVAEADQLKVRLKDEREFKATVVGTDPSSDLAVVKIDAKGIVAAELGDSSGLRVGQWVLAVGSPLGLMHSVTAGIVSATGRGNLRITEYGDFIQTDAAINRGNSGGPLIDLSGRVVGINTAIASSTGGYQGIGFAIPVHIAKRVMEQLIGGGKVKRGWLGVALRSLSDDEGKALARSFGFTGDGVLLEDVLPAGPGAKAGLQAGDIVTEIEGKPVKDVDALRDRVAEVAPGKKFALQVFREGKSLKITVEAGERPSREAMAKESAQDLGMVFVDPDRALRGRFGFDEVAKGALVVEVAPGGLAARAGLAPGDLIVAVGSTPVTSIEEARRKLQEADLKKGVRLRVRRGGETGGGRFVVLRQTEEEEAATPPKSPTQPGARPNPGRRGR